MGCESKNILRSEYVLPATEILLFPMKIKGIKSERSELRNVILYAPAEL